MKRKVLSVNDGGVCFEVIKDDTQKYNPYRIYRKWYDCGWHRKYMTNYCEMISCIEWIADIMKDDLRWKH